LHPAGLGLKGDLYEITLAQGTRELQQTSGDGNGVKFGFGPLTVFSVDERRE